MGEISKAVSKIVVAVASASLVGGVVLFFGLNTYVAHMMGTVVNSSQLAAITLMIAGAASLIGMVLWLAFSADERIYGIWSSSRTRKKRNAQRLRLADLRDEGVAIRKEAMELPSVELVEPWIRKAQDWNFRVVAAIADIDEPDSRQFATLDFPGKPRAHLEGYYSERHMRFYVMHDRRLVRLDEYMTRYSNRRFKEDA